MGRWYEHGSVLTVKADGTFAWSSTLGASSPTTTVDGTVHAVGPARASATVTSSSDPARVGRMITMTVDPANDTLTVSGPGASPSGAPLLPFCGPSAPAGTCGA